MNLRITVNLLALLAASTVSLSHAAPTQERDAPSRKSAPHVNVAPASKPAAAQVPGRAIERPAFTMTCPAPSDITLHLSYTMQSWSVNPSQLQPAEFIRAYGQIDSGNKSKVTLACIYQATGDYVASTTYNGLQKCYANETTGEGKINYTVPEGFKSNVAGTTAPGKLDVKNTGHSVTGQRLDCQFHAEGQVQLFKKEATTGRLSTCEASSRSVKCYFE